MPRTIIIAEAGVNHNGSIDLATQLIDVAAEAGADYVKFQTFKAEKLVSPSAAKASYQNTNTADGDSFQLQMLKKLELDIDKHKALISHAASRGIKFLSTPFDLESVDLLIELGIGLFKIPSGEITNLPLIEKIGKANKPVILSTGMSKISEIEEALDVLFSVGLSRDGITVLHCNTEYPTPMRDVNLKAMTTIAHTFGVATGYSDHTLGIEVPIAAVALGATVIEKHFTLDRTLPGPDHQASLEPAELRQMVSSIRNIEVALGDGLKKPSLSEEKNLNVARKSIHLMRDMKRNEVIKLEDMIMLRPGDGISPMEYKRIVGRKLGQDLKQGHKLTWKDIIE